jgi:hypothetical protein
MTLAKWSLSFVEVIWKREVQNPLLCARFGVPLPPLRREGSKRSSSRRTPRELFFIYDPTRSAGPIEISGLMQYTSIQVDPEPNAAENLRITPLFREGLGCRILGAISWSLAGVASGYLRHSVKMVVFYFSDVILRPRES